MPAKISDTGILVGKRLREIRKQQHVTAVAVAKQVKCTPTHLYDIEMGKRQPSLELFKRLCLALKVSADQILGIDTSKLDDPATAA